MFPVKEIEEISRKEVGKRDFNTHDFTHLKRVADGAVWFVGILGGNKEEQELAYLAGILHDVVRPKTEKVPHAYLSAEKSREILDGFGLSRGHIEKICEAIKDHSDPPGRWKSPLHQSVYLADKILEQMGAYVVFRRLLFVTECVDYRDSQIDEAVKHQFGKRLERFNPEAFPERFRKLVEYQYRWPLQYLEDFEAGKEWAMELRDFCVKNKNLSVGDLIVGFNPRNKEGKGYKEEALKYIKGKKFREFEGLL